VATGVIKLDVRHATILTSAGERSVGGWQDRSVEKLTSAKLPRPAGPYSHLAVAGGLVFTAGFGPQDPATGAVPDGVRAQTEAVIRNVERALAEVGLDLSHVVKVTAHLADLADFAAYNAVYERLFPAPYPVRTTVGSQLADILVEIDVVAALP
jgi:reactive intermediate/imine deaminase